MFFVGLGLAVARASAYAVLDAKMQYSFGWWNYREDGEGIIPSVMGDCPFVLAIDGPLGWAGSAGRRRRCCEASLNTPGKAPYDRKPGFAGEYITKSDDLFARLTKQKRFRLLGLDGTPARAATLIEVYPGSAWRVLANEPLPSKKTATGMDSRREPLEEVGLTFPAACAPNHDQLDAALVAWIARQLHCGERGVCREGERSQFDAKAGCLREGYIVRPASRTCQFDGTRIA